MEAVVEQPEIRNEEMNMDMRTDTGAGVWPYGAADS
jgi:hypothetical protein